jgi:hypothetical protein
MPPAKPEPDEQEDELKRKFREALERKREQQAEGAAGEGKGSKIHSAHGPARSQRSFRRRSGG